jgi:hypothetical protein
MCLWLAVTPIHFGSALAHSWLRFSLFLLGIMLAVFEKDQIGSRMLMPSRGLMKFSGSSRSESGEVWVSDNRCFAAVLSEWGDMLMLL